MRILNICAYTWAIGGPARIIYDHTSEALKLGHQVTILSPMTPGEKLYEVPEGARLIPCRRTVPLSHVYREFSLDLYQYLKKHINEYDVIHIHGIWHFGSLAPFLIKNKVSKVITIHGLLDKWAIGHHRWKKDLVSYLYQKNILEKANLIHVNNTDEQADVTGYLGKVPANLRIIPNGIRLDEFAVLPPTQMFRGPFGIPKDKKMILFMGRLNIKKGLDLLLPAFEEYNQAKEDAILVLAGPDDGYQVEVEKFIKENSIESAVRLVGLLTSDVKKAALADADYFVLPSYSEGFSIAVLEAMASGIPVLVSDRVGFGNAIETYNAACIVELTPESVKEGLLEMLGNDSLCETRKKNAHRMLNENFDIVTVAKKMVDAYSELLPAAG